MKKPEKSTRLFLIDINVFISAVKNPRGDTLRLLIKLIEDPSIKLVGNDLLAEEYLRYAEVFKSETVLGIVLALLGKMELIRVEESHIHACKPFIDILHAATCLKSGSILITNDKHFDKLHERKIIEVWSIPKALNELMEF
ncbi:MAG: PIN domain-containing protein [Candidatus Hydrothermarchaeota archaeon]|nr:PIN domain-containing protein [Candidatus Hydrothermarchaeota archaeon]